MTSLYRLPTRPATREDDLTPGREPEQLPKRDAAGLSRAEIRQIVADLLG